MTVRAISKYLVSSSRTSSGSLTSDSVVNPTRSQNSTEHTRSLGHRIGRRRQLNRAGGGALSRWRPPIRSRHRTACRPLTRHRRWGTPATVSPRTLRSTACQRDCSPRIVHTAHRLPPLRPHLRSRDWVRRVLAAELLSSAAAARHRGRRSDRGSRRRCRRSRAVAGRGSLSVESFRPATPAPPG